MPEDLFEYAFLLLLLLAVILTILSLLGGDIQGLIRSIPWSLTP